jgi:tetratricopeptide (TPR) repeat protein
MFRSAIPILCFSACSLIGCNKGENAGGPAPASQPAVRAAESIARSSAPQPKPDPLITLAQLEEQVRSGSLSPQKQQEIQQLLGQAKGALAKKDFAGAEKCIQDALALDSTNMALGKLQRELRAARQAEADAASATEIEAKKKRDAAIAEKKEKYAKLMQEGKEALSAEEFDKASKLFAEAAKLNPDDNDAPLLQGMADKQKIVAEKEAEAAKKAEQEEEKRKKEEAENDKKRAANEAEAKKKGEEELRRKLDMDIEARKRADQLKNINQRDQLREWLSQANELQKQKKWLEAITLYQQILSSQPEDQAARNGAKMCQFQMLMEAGRAALVKGDKETAIKRFESAAKLFPKDEELQRLLQQARDEK